MKNLRFGYNVRIGILFLAGTAFMYPAKSQTNSDGSSPQFLYSDFNEAKVRMKNGQSQSIILNYNTVSEKMVYEKEDKLYDMVNTELMDTVYILENKFVPAGNVFYQVLLAAPAAFFVQHRGEIIPPGTPAGYGGTSQVSNTKLMTSVQLSQGYYNLKLPSDFTVKVDEVYWVRIAGNMFSFTNERQFLKIFPDDATELKKFIKQNRIKFDNIPDIVKLAKYFNESLK